MTIDQCSSRLGLRTLNTAVLQINKGGPKFKEATHGDTVTAPDGTPISPTTWLRTGPSELAAHAVTMTTLVQMISGHADRIVIDQTGLTGKYTLILKFDTSGVGGPQMPEGLSPPFVNLLHEVSKPIEFAAVNEQLGLKLVSSKAPVEGVAIDHIERPPDS